MKEGPQRQELQAWFTPLVDARQARIHGFNVSVAHVWAEQERLLEKADQRMPVDAERCSVLHACRLTGQVRSVGVCRNQEGNRNSGGKPRRRTAA